MPDFGISQFLKLFTWSNILGKPTTFDPSAHSHSSDEETLTNKTLTAPVLGNYIDYTRIAAPSDPGASIARAYHKQIDSNNDGWFIKVKKNGTIVEVQIA